MISSNLVLIGNVALLAFGFGFVVFWHELGHFLAAKWAGVKVEQFAVGMGHAVLSWRKGVGLRLGNSQAEFKKRIEEHLQAKGELPKRESQGQESDDAAGPTELQTARAAAELGVSETEYRLNWIPIGGYVKMLGQDDLRPNSEAEDPRAFNRQSIGKRMVIVSAGVIMNVILAAIGFMVLFMYGFKVPTSVVGSILPGSPAQAAAMHIGDRIISIDGKLEHDDWTKVPLGTALCDGDTPVPIVVDRLENGERKPMKLDVKLRRGGGSSEFLGLGISPPSLMRMQSVKEKEKDEDPAMSPELKRQLFLPDASALKSGDVILAVNGTPVPQEDEHSSLPTAFVVLDDAVQASNGKQISLSVAGNDGRDTPKLVKIQPHFMEPFGGDELNFAGMVPRMMISGVLEKSPNFSKILPGDVVLSVSTSAGSGASQENPSIAAFKQNMSLLGAAGTEKVDLVVQRGDKRETLTGLKITSLTKETWGLMMSPAYDDAGKPVVAEVLPDSAAKSAMILPGSTILQVNEHPVNNWFDVQMRLNQFAQANEANGAAQASVTFQTPGGELRTGQLHLSSEEAKAVENCRFRTELQLPTAENIRHSSNPLVSAEWGVVETRDFILQFYLTLRRMVTGSVAAKNLMGPVGIFQAGTSFASKGNDWLIWFLAMISANLAVVNFLPIPIVDGGLFTFLILEKIKGRPLSPKTQEIAQYVGIALLLTVFLFVTWQDILRIWH